MQEWLAEDAFEHSVFHQMSVEFSQPAVIADLHFFQAFAGNLGNKSAEFFSELDVWLELLVLLRGDGWHVDGVARNTQPQIVPNLLCDADSHIFQRFIGRAGDV